MALSTFAIRSFPHPHLYVHRLPPANINDYYYKRLSKMFVLACRIIVNNVSHLCVFRFAQYAASSLFLNFTILSMSALKSS